MTSVAHVIELLGLKGNVGSVAYDLVRSVQIEVEKPENMGQNESQILVQVANVLAIFEVSEQLRGIRVELANIHGAVTNLER